MRPHFLSALLIHNNIFKNLYCFSKLSLNKYWYTYQIRHKSLFIFIIQFSIFNFIYLLFLLEPDIAQKSILYFYLSKNRNSNFFTFLNKNLSRNLSFIFYLSKNKNSDFFWHFSIIIYLEIYLLFLLESDSAQNYILYFT